jgi:hypothetical protein
MRKHLLLVLAPLACSPATKPADPITVVAAPPPTVDAGPAPIAAAPPPPPPARPQPPPVEPLDPNLDAFAWTFLGASETHAWFSTMTETDGQPGYSVVVDLATACATESYRDPRIFEDVRKMTSDRDIENALDAGSAEIRRTVGLASRFGLTSLFYTPVAWNTDGPHVLVHAGLMYHSSDGGRRFAAIDNHPASDAKITPDGKTAVYERCHDPEAMTGRALCSSYVELVSWPLDGSRAPLVLTALGGRGVRNEGISKDGHAIVWRDDATHGCLELIDVATAKIDRNVCITDPHFAKQPMPKKKGEPPTAGPPEPSGVQWLGMSPDERYGALSWTGFTTRYLTFETALVDMGSAKIARTLPEWQLHGLDDAGTALVTPWAEGGGDATRMFELGKPAKVLWKEFMFDWNPKTRRALLDVSRRVKVKLGKAACKIVRVARSP